MRIKVKKKLAQEREKMKCSSRAHAREGEEPEGLGVSRLSGFLCEKKLTVRDAAGVISYTQSNRKSAKGVRSHGGARTAPEVYAGAA